MLKKTVMLGMLWAAASTPAMANDGEFTCVTPTQFLDVTAGDDGLRMNNFNIGERKALLAPNLHVVEVSFSVSNRTAAASYLKGQFIGYDEASAPLFAVTAGPMMDMIGPNKTDTANGDAYVADGTLAKLHRICLHIVASRKPAG